MIISNINQVIILILHEYNIKLKIIQLDLIIFAGIDKHIKHTPGNNNNTA